MKIGDLYVIHSKKKTLETVKINKIKGDDVHVTVVDGSKKYIGDKFILSKANSKFLGFIDNEDTRSKWRKFLDRIFA